VDKTLALLADKRVWQLYDRTHLMSDQMRKGMLAHPSAIPVTRQRTHRSEEGILWDAVADVTSEFKAFLKGTVIANAGASPG
jgi:hypothetical protein